MPTIANTLPPPSILLDALLASLPILAVLVLMLRYRWGGAQAGAIGWVLTQLIALLFFGASPSVLFYAQLKGILLTIYVLYIIWAALLFYRVTDEAGLVRAIGYWLPRLTPDRALQALLLGWIFSSFLQGVGGFGVPVAVIAPLLVGLGFSPTTAVVIPSVGHGWAVTFGSLGASFYALIAATGRNGSELAPPAALFLGLACFWCGASVLWAAGGKRTLRSGLLPLLAIGLTMSISLFLVVARGLWALGSTIATLLGLGVAVAWSRWRQSNEAATRSADNPPTAGNASAIIPPGWALLPYLLLIAIVLAANLLTPVSDFLGQVVIRFDFPELTTARGWVTPAGPGRTIDIFGHAGALLVYASFISYVVLRWRGYLTPAAMPRILRGVINGALRSSLGIAAMVGMAATMEHAGMTYLLASGIARVAGSAFPMVAPFIGALGAFMTGSNTNSNVVFGSLQQQIALLTHISPVIILAAQTSGAAIGSIFAPAKIIVGCSTVKLGGKEGAVLADIMRYGLLMLAFLALLTTVAVYALSAM
nr:L-lactate permease [Chloroflexota bacterium]